MHSFPVTAFRPQPSGHSPPVTAFPAVSWPPSFSVRTVRRNPNPNPLTPTLTLTPTVTLTPTLTLTLTLILTPTLPLTLASR